MGFRREVGGEPRGDIVGKRLEVETSRQRRCVQSIDRLVCAVAGAGPHSEIVAALVGECLEEEGAQRRIVADDGVGIGASLVTVMV